MSNHQDFENLNPDFILDAIESTGRICDGCILALNSYENRVYRIGIENSDAIIAKFYRPERWNSEQILEDHEFSIELCNHDLPIIPPIMDENGITLHRHKNFDFSLFQLRGGRAPELDNPKQLEQMGRFLARIHLVGETKQFKHRPRVSVNHLGREQVSYLLSSNFLPSETKASYAAITENLLQKIEINFTLAGDFKNLRIHADMHPGNILWRDNTPHIVDLDDCAMGPAIQDIWMFLSGDRNYQMARLGDLLSGYEQFREFDTRELILVEALRALRQINYAAWLAKRWQDPAFKQAFVWFNTPRFWDDHILALREQRAIMDEPALQW